MAITYSNVATYTVATPAASYTFNSFTGYTDLVLVITGQTTTAGQDILITVNGDNGSNYSRSLVLGTGTTFPSTRDANQAWYAPGGAYENSLTLINFMNYSNTTTYKTFLSRNNAPTQYTVEGVGVWRNTAAITSITITTQTFNMATGSTFTLYGIKAA
jgi:hypothetical protein